MRKIKFRAWDGHRMNYFSNHKTGLLYQYEEMRLSSGYDSYDNPTFNDDISFELMQYIGLKDKNGVEIYEGDVLKHHGIVAWNDVELCWSRIDLNWNERREWHELQSLTSPLEIIGNIYENPEYERN